MSVYEHAQAFWKEFAARQPEIEQALIQKEYPDLLHALEPLQESARELTGCGFFVEDAADQFEMTFDPGPNKTSQYLARYFTELCPDDILRKWIVNPVLMPLSQKAIEAQVQIKDHIYTLMDFHVFYTLDQQSQTFQCQVYCPGYSLIDNEENKREMSMYLMELAIGQTLYEAYIGSVTFTDQPPKESQAFCPLADFYEAIMTVVERDHWKTYRSPLEIYSVYQPFQDFAHDSLRRDMKIIFTTHPLLAEETLGSGSDVLLDLKTKDGEYGYMYYANPYNGKDDALLRQEISRQLDKAMSSLHAGQVVGGAMGKSYSYIDWIVYDRSKFLKAFEQLKKQLDDKVELHYQAFGIEEEPRGMQVTQISDPDADETEKD